MDPGSSSAPARRSQFAREAIRSRRSVRFEEERDGIAFQHTIYPIEEKTDEVMGIAVFTRDITVQKEAQEKLLQQTTILEGINRIFEETISCDTEQDLMRICLDQAMSITGSQMGFLGELGPDGWLHVLVFSEHAWRQSTMADDGDHSRPYTLPLKGLYGRVLKKGKSVWTNHPEAHPDSTGLPAGHPPISAFLGVPFIIEGRTVGIVAVANRKGGYRCRDQESLEALAPAILETWHYHRSEQRVRESEERLRVAVDGGRLGLWDHDFENDSSVWNDRLYRLLGRDPAEPITGETFFDYIHPEDKKRVMAHVEQWLARGKTFQDEFRIMRDDGQVRWMASSGRAYRDEDGRPVRMAGVNYDITRRKTIEAELAQYRAELEVRVQARTADLHHANAALLREIEEHRKAREQVRHLSKRLMEVQEEERREMARELHDGLGGDIMGIKMAVEGHFGALRKKGSAGEEADPGPILDRVSTTIDTLRRIQHHLRPSVLDDLGLLDALQDLCRDMNRAHESMRVACELEADEAEIPEPLKIVLYRISQEALTNAVKHSGAGRTNLSLHQRKDGLRLTIHDDGCGFDPGAPAGTREERTGFGLESMRERCELSGGMFSIQSDPGKGTTVQADWTLALSPG